MKKSLLPILALSMFAVTSENWAQPKLDAQIYELRTYTTHDGSLPKLHARFRDHTNHIFVKHGMKLIAYWVPADEDNKLIYVLAFQSVEAREKAWEAFRDDPDVLVFSFLNNRLFHIFRFLPRHRLHLILRTPFKPIPGPTGKVVRDFDQVLHRGHSEYELNFLLIPAVQVFRLRKVCVTA